MKNKNKAEGVTAVCRDCGAEFFTEASELEWLEKNGLHPFSRCPECRAKRKADKARRAASAPAGETHRPW